MVMHRMVSQPCGSCFSITLALDASRTTIAPSRSAAHTVEPTRHAQRTSAEKDGGWSVAAPLVLGRRAEFVAVASFDLLVLLATVVRTRRAGNSLGTSRSDHFGHKQLGHRFASIVGIIVTGGSFSASGSSKWSEWTSSAELESLFHGRVHGSAMIAVARIEKLADRNLFVGAHDDAVKWRFLLTHSTFSNLAMKKPSVPSAGSNR